MSKHQVGYIIFGIFSLIYALGMIFLSWSLLYYIPFLLLWVAVLIYGSFTIQANYHLKAICQFSTQEKLVAITFDDGPTQFTAEVLDLLKKYNFKATFFCIGNHLKTQTEIVQKIKKEGHTIGNHSLTHREIGLQKPEIILSELQQTDRIIEEITGQKIEFYRPPFGVTNPNIRKALKQSHHTVIGWNIRSLDTSIKDKNRILKRIKKRLKPGSIILLHDTSEKSVHVLEQLLTYLSQNNYRSISIEEMVNLNL